MLHALLDVLPYPVGKRGMSYDIKTGSVECVDEVELPGGAEGEGAVDLAVGAQADIGGMEENEPDVRARIVVSSPSLLS